jgi:antitoxin component YwqK of YwqJK toxin-antitoxin module
MATLLDIFKMKVTGGSLILKDDTFLFVSKITGTILDKDTKDITNGSETLRGDMTISYEDGNGAKREVKLSQIKEAHPMSEQSVFSIMNNIAKMKNENYKGYFITNDGNRIGVNLIVSFENLILTYIGIDDDYERTVELKDIKEVHINTNEKYIKETYLGECEKYYTLINGKKEGIQRTYKLVGQGGALMTMSVYKDGKLEGLHRQWNDAGKLIHKCFYKDGKLEGAYQEWNDDILVFDCCYKDGKLEGEVREWDDDTGKLVEHSLYKDGKFVKNLLQSNKLTRQFAYIPPETIDKNIGQNLEIEMGQFKKRKVSECSSVEVPLMDDDLEQVLNRTREENYKLIEDLIDKGIEKFEITSQSVPKDVYEILIMSKGKKKWFAVIQNENEDVFILDMNSLFAVSAVPPCDKPEKVKNGNLPLCKTLIDRRTFYSNSVFSKEINNMIALSKALIADGEVMYNFYVKKSLKETMIEKILKDNLKNDFNILSDELRKGNHEILIYRDNILVKLIFNFEENSNIYCETYSSVDANVEFHSPEMLQTTNVVSESKPLPSNLTRYFEDDVPQTPKKEKVVEVPQAPRKKRNCSNTSSTVSKKLHFEEPSQEDTSVNIPTDRIVTFIYKGDEKKVLVKEANEKYTEGICQTDNKYKKYLTRYIGKVIKVEDPLDEDTFSEDTSSEDEQSQSIPTYKNMILNAIRTCYVNGTRGLSRQALQAYIMGNYNVKIGHFHKNLRMTLKRLVETGCIVQTKQKFKLGDEGRKYLKEQQRNYATKADTKKVEKNTEKCDNKAIQDAIDNEKILDIVYDGGSIPDVKRPVRPKRVYTASNGTQILEAICLIDDKVKKFSLDKVKVIA